MAYETVDCVDAGSEYCPCYLAETNDCLICSQLQGKAFCDCINWKGVCIYQEYVWNSCKRKESRENTVVKILDKSMVNENVIYMKIKITRTLARELNQPGSYIFIRYETYPESFSVPMSIMYSDEVEETADLLIQVRGIKTKVLKNADKTVLIKGPYWNGILGLKNLKMTSNKNCLIITRGIAQAPSVLIAKKLKFSGNNITVIFDKGRAGTTFAEKYFADLGCSIIESPLLKDKMLSEEARALIKDIIRDRNIEFIFSGGTDRIHKGIIEIIRDFPKGILFSCTNNASICCGEGICGSCHTRLKDGRRIKSCKAQLDPIDILGGI